MGEVFKQIISHFFTGNLKSSNNTGGTDLLQIGDRKQLGLRVLANELHDYYIKHK